MRFCIFTLSFGLAALSGCSRDALGPSSDDSVLFKLGSAYLTRSEMESRILEVGPDYVPYLRSDVGKKTILKAILRAKLLAAIARDKNLGSDPMFKQEMSRLKKEQQRALRLYSESLLTEKLIERLRQEELKISDEELANYYKTHKNLYHVRHILVTQEDMARRLAGQLRKKRSSFQEFGNLAKTYSQEASSSRNSGRMPPYLEGELDESFEQAVRALKIGEVSDIVKSDFGYHLIILENVTLAPFNDDIKERVTRVLEKKKLDSLIDLWKNKYKVEVKDETLRPYLSL